MNTISKFIKQIKQRISEKRKENRKRFVNELFQIKELNGEVWLTYNGDYIAPMNMFKGDCMEILTRLRTSWLINNEAI